MVEDSSIKAVGVGQASANVVRPVVVADDDREQGVARRVIALIGKGVHGEPESIVEILVVVPRCHDDRLVFFPVLADRVVLYEGPIEAVVDAFAAWPPGAEVGEPLFVRLECELADCFARRVRSVTRKEQDEVRIGLLYPAGPLLQALEAPEVEPPAVEIFSSDQLAIQSGQSLMASLTARLTAAAWWRARARPRSSSSTRQTASAVSRAASAVYGARVLGPRASVRAYLAREETVSTLWIVVAVVIGLAALTFVYAVFRLPWRLRQGDVETAHRDSDTWRGRSSE